VQLRCCKERKTALTGCFSHFRVTGSTSWNFTPLFLAELQYVVILNRSFTQPIWFQPFQPTLQPTSVAKRRRQQHVDQVLNKTIAQSGFQTFLDTWFSCFLSSQSAHLFPKGHCECLRSQPGDSSAQFAILRFFVNRVSGVVIFCAFRNNPTITWADQTSHVPGFPGAGSSQSIEYWM
jgi:hypothetical protein